VGALVVGRVRGDPVRRSAKRSVPFTSAPGSPVSGLGLVAPSVDGVRSTVANSYSRVPLEPLTVQWLASVVSPGDRAVDVGANVGLFSIALSGLVGAGGEVIAIEPGSSNVACLRSNLARHARSKVEVVPVAAGREHGQLELTVGDNTLISTLTSAPTRRRGRRGRAQVESVPVRRLDDVVAPGPVAVLKLDIEGGEVEALLGAERLLTG
jgi:FkbM family methyltransferase